MYNHTAPIFIPPAEVRYDITLAMKSPFPGMDPYLEGFWNDVHGKLVAYLADELNESLPAGYRASIDKRLVISDVENPRPAARFPDVSVLQWPSAGDQGPVATQIHSQHLLLSSPEHISYWNEPLTEYFLEILDTSHSEKLVTAIEVLSPENKKPGDGMTQFRRKQDELRSARVNRVEIDLLRAGRRLFEFPPQMLSDEKPYYITVHRGNQPRMAEVYAIDLRDRLPMIEIPLRPGEAGVRLDLQPLLDRVYRSSRFPIDYNLPCEPPLTGIEAEFAASLVKKTAALTAE
jgi:hypothetical protein